MKKLSLLFTMLALLFVGGAQAATKEFAFSLADATVSGTDATIDATTGEVTMKWNNYIYWDLSKLTVGNDISAYKKLVVKLSKASEKDFSVYLNDGGSWYPLGNNSLTTVSKGQTSVTIDLSTLTHTGLSTDSNDVGDGNALDLTSVDAIGFATRVYTGGFDEASFTVESATLVSEDYDEVETIPATDSSLFPLTNEGVNLTIWGTNNSFDATTTTFTFGSNGNAVGWTFSAQDLSAYNKLVVDLQEATDYDFSLRFRNATAKSTGKDVHYISLSANNTHYEIDLTTAQFKYDDQSSNPDVNLDLTDINAIYFWAWVENKSLKVKDIYLVKATGEQVYLVRQNTETGKYGTICLPFAASKPGNATVYSVVGYDDSNVYLKEAESLEAGKAYVFQSTDANDITFTKNSTGNNLTAPATATSGLIGTFTASTPVPKDSYILSGGQWLKVTADGNNTVNAYRAYLTLGDDLKVTESQAKAFGAKAMRINGGQTTAIDSVNAAATVDAPAYNLAGQRVSNGYKGVVVKNGKKYIAK